MQIRAGVGEPFVVFLPLHEAFLGDVVEFHRHQLVRTSQKEIKTWGYESYFFCHLLKYLEERESESV